MLPEVEGEAVDWSKMLVQRRKGECVGGDD